MRNPREVRLRFNDIWFCPEFLDIAINRFVYKYGRGHVLTALTSSRPDNIHCMTIDNKYVLNPTRWVQLMLPLNSDHGNPQQLPAAVDFHRHCSNVQFFLVKFIWKWSYILNTCIIIWLFGRLNTIDDDAGYILLPVWLRHLWHSGRPPLYYDHDQVLKQLGSMTL